MLAGILSSFGVHACYGCGASGALTNGFYEHQCLPELMFPDVNAAKSSSCSVCWGYDLSVMGFTISECVVVEIAFSALDLKEQRRMLK